MLSFPSLLVKEAGILGDLHLLAQVEQDVGELLLRATDEAFMKPRRDGVGLTTGGELGEKALALARELRCL